MKRLFLVLLIAVGCSDGLFGPDSATSIAIEMDAAQISEATLLVGEVILLEVAFAGRFRDQGVDWRSENPTVVAVSTNGEATGIGEGDTRIIAEAGGQRDTVLVTVLAGAPEGGHCGSAGGLRLERGESYTTTATGAESLCVEGGERFEQYIIVPFNAASAGTALRVEISDLRQAADLGLAETAPSSAMQRPPGFRPNGLERSIEADLRLRQREARDLAPLVGASAARRGPSFAIMPAMIPARGDLLSLNVNSEKSCTAPINRKFRVAAVSRQAIVLHDLENPAGGFSDADYEAFATAFDEVVHPTAVRNFGRSSDIDGNDRVLIAFTRAVNEMTSRSAEAYVAGFFYARDLFPRKDSSGLRGCATSNVGEILYLMTPDPMGEINGNIRSRSFIAERTMGVIAHELQHLVGASRRLRVIGVENWVEEFWLNEGLSHIAEELTFYAAASMAPREEIRLQDLPLGSGAMTSFNQFQSTNFSRFASYLRSPDGTSAVSGVDLATRGASWAFLRYAADRRGGSESELWQRLVDSGSLGYDNLAEALGVSPLSWVHDWAVSLYADDLVSQVASRFRQPSWHFRSIMPALSGNRSTYPLHIEDLRPGTKPKAELELAAAGAAIVRFSLPIGGSIELHTTSGGAPPPPHLRLTLIRTR